MSSTPSEIPKPEIVFVPGAFHTEAHFQPISKALQQLSYPTRTLALPSIGPKAGIATLDDDIKAIRSTLLRLVEDDKEILLIPHAYGAVPACQAVAGLERSQRIEEEKKGGVVQIIFMAGVVPEEGQSLAESLGGGLPPYAKADVGLIHLLLRNNPY